MGGRPNKNLPKRASLKDLAISWIFASEKWTAGLPLCNWIDEVVEPVTISTNDFCGLKVALGLRTVTGLRAKAYKGLGLMLVLWFGGVGLVEWVLVATWVRSLWVVGGGCWDVYVGNVVSERFEGGNSWSLLFWCGCGYVRCSQSCLRNLVDHHHQWLLKP